MSRSNITARDRFRDSLSAEAEKIRKLEDEAEKLLHQDQDVSGYKDKLLQKTAVMKELPALASELEQGLDPQQIQEIRAKLEDFAHRAVQAEEVDSIFFMRQLLYSEDYVPGQDNELEQFIRNLTV